MNAPHDCADHALQSLIVTTLTRFYATHAPGAGERLAARHARIWDSVLAGESVAETRAAFAREAESLGCSPARLSAADDEVMWELTPQIAASLACGPGGDPVCLKEVGAALEEILTNAVKSGGARAFSTAA